MFFSFLIFVLFTFNIQEKKEIIWFLSLLFHCTLMHSFFPTLLGYLDSTLVGYIGVIGSSRLGLVLDKLYIKLRLLVVAQSYTSFNIYININIYIYIYKIKINIATYFENLIIGLHVLYALIKHVKFCTNQLLFTIQSINIFYI